MLTRNILKLCDIVTAINASMNGHQNDQVVIKEEKEEKEETIVKQEESPEDLETESDFRCQLYVRFPCTLPPLDEIKALHPGIVQVFARKRKKPKFCYLAFSSPEAAQKAMIELASATYKNLGHLEVRPKDDHLILPRSTGTGDQKKRWLIISGIPPEESDLEVLQTFKKYGCTHAHVHHRDINPLLKKGSARLVFNTLGDSQAFILNKELHFYKGNPIDVQFLRMGPSKSTRKRQKRKERKLLEEQMELR